MSDQGIIIAQPALPPALAKIAPIVGTGHQAAPVAGTVVAQASNPVVGAWYQITGFFSVGGATAVADVSNMRLSTNAVDVVNPLAVGPGAGANLGPFLYLIPVGTTFLAVVVLNNATAGTEYAATIILQQTT